MKKSQRIQGRRRIYLFLFTILVIVISAHFYRQNQQRSVNRQVEQPTLSIIEPVLAQEEPIVVPEPTPEPVVQPVEPASVVTDPQPVVVPVVNNEQIVWDYFISKGYSRIAVAGISGNLMQENRFQTTAHESGLGIAQWMGNRRYLLEIRPNYLDINVQLDYLNHELNTGYSTVRDGLNTATTIEQATIVFQNEFERCGDCRESQRVQYAYEILARH